MKTHPRTRVWSLVVLVLSLLAAGSAQALIPTVLSDKIHKGSGTIDILKNATSSELSSYLQANKRLFLAIDVNESSAAPESARSQGVALKSMKLLLSTTAGDFSFSDFYTNTTAMIREAGSATARQWYTAFGTSGSNDLTSSTSGFNLSVFDDVIVMDNINFTGNILSAKLEVKFLDTEQTGKNAGVNEMFFNYSGGFEDFALLSPQDARLLDKAAIGQAQAPSGVTVVQDTAKEVATILTPPASSGTTTPDPTAPTPSEPVSGPDPTAPAPSEPVAGTDPTAPATGGTTDPTAPASGGGTVDAGGTNSPVVAAPGAPAPPMLLLMAGAGLLAFQQYRRTRAPL